MLVLKEKEITNKRVSTRCVPQQYPLGNPLITGELWGPFSARYNPIDIRVFLNNQTSWCGKARILYDGVLCGKSGAYTQKKSEECI